MRTHLILLAALAGILLAGPSRAQTAVNCVTAAEAMAQTGQAGKQLDLRVTYDDIDTVNRVIRGTVGAMYIGRADNIQVFYVEPGTYLLMASVQGCHVSHVFVDGSGIGRLAAST